jgi:ribosomal protein S27E
MTRAQDPDMAYPTTAAHPRRLACPHCGETDLILAQRARHEHTDVRCVACGHVWNALEPGAIQGGTARLAR